MLILVDYFRTNNQNEVYSNDKQNKLDYLFAQIVLLQLYAVNKNQTIRDMHFLQPNIHGYLFCFVWTIHKKNND